MIRKPFLFTLVFCFAVMHGSFAQVVINEVQSSNWSSIQDEKGAYEDWVELYNTGSSAVDLAGYGLSDNQDQLYKFTFPSCVLQAHDHILVFANDVNQTLVGSHWASAVRADFTWRYRVNTAAPPDTNWRNISFSDVSWSSGQGGIGMGDSDDATVIAACPSYYMRRTFNISDTSKILDAVFNLDYDDGFVAYLNGVEIARANLGTPGDRPAWNAYSFGSYEAQMYQGMPCDSFHISSERLHAIIRNGSNVLAIEVHNQNASSNDLTSIPYLSFHIKDATTMFSAVPSWFSSNQHPKEYFHAAFKISKTGETIFLAAPGGNIIDQAGIPPLEYDNSFGRETDGASVWSYFGTPTPDTSNNLSSGANGYATAPVFSLQGGFYSGPQTLTLTTSFPGGIIRYTTNGNMPTAGSTLYTTPLVISSTQTVRARVFSSTSLPGVAVTNTYFINVNCKLPVYSLVLDSADLWDYNKGIFVKGPNASLSQPYFGANFWQDWQKYTSLEFFDKQKNRAFRFNAGLSITGGWSRRYDQKSLEVNLGDRFGLSKIQYDMIPDKKWIDKWDDFLLHTSGNDRGYAHMRDPVMERLMKGTHSDYTAYEPCLLYINGAQWGVYYTKENDDQNFIRLNYGYGKSEIDLLKESYFYPDIEVKCGNDSAFRNMHSYAMNASPSSASFYAAMDSMMDLKNQVDYFAAECYYPNDDWMGGSNNNLKLWRPGKADGRFRYILYDLDFGFGMYGTVSDDILSIAMNANPHNYNSDIFQRLLQNPQYKNYFINRYADLINTIWTPANVAAVVNEFKDSMRYDMHYQFDKWGNGDSTTWKANIDNVLNFSAARPAYARNQIESNLGLSGQVLLTLQASPAGSGRIQISTITPQSLPWSGVYFNGNPVTLTAIPNPGYAFDHWHSNVAITTNDSNQAVTRNFTSADSIIAFFTGSPSSPQVTISEINYNSDSSSNAGDWIELHNLSTFDLDISGWKLRDDNDHHEFIFPVSTVVAANGYLVVAENLNKFHAQHPLVTNVTGETGFNFSDGGDQIRLFRYNDSIYLAVEYSDQDPWTSAADGNGYTLELLNPAGDLNDGNNWFAGCPGGSPGKAFTPPAASFTSSGPLEICADDTLILSAQTAVGNSYQWKKNGVNIPGATNADYQPSESGAYSLTVTNGGCEVTSDSSAIKINPRSLVPVTTSVIRCGTGSVTLAAQSADSVKWFDANLQLVGTGTSYTTPSLSSSAIYFTQAISACPSQLVADTITIESLPADPVASGQSICGHGVATLTAASNDVLRWYDAPGGNLLFIGNAFSTPDVSLTTTYYVQAGDQCKSAEVPVTATVHPVSADPVVNNVSRCDEGSLLLSAVSPDTLNWYDAPNGNLIFSGTSYQTPVITATSTYFVRAGITCPSNYVPVQAIVSPVTPDPVIPGQSRCGSGSVLLSATATDTVRWYDSPNGALLYTGADFVTPPLNLSTTYFVTAGTACVSNEVPVEATIYQMSGDPIVTNGERCGEGSVLLTAISPDTVRWYDAPGGNFLAEGLTFNTPSVPHTTTYFVQAGTICPGNYLPVTAFITPVPASPAAQDESRCGEGSLTLVALGNDTVRWYDSPNGNLLAEGATFITPVLHESATYFVRTENICATDYIPVQASVVPLPADPVVTPGSSCGPGMVTLSALSQDTVQWLDNPNGMLLGIGNTFTTPFISSTTTYYAEGANGCKGNAIAVDAIINSNPEFSLGNDTIIESGSTIVLDAGSGYTSYQWSSGETTQTAAVNSTGNYMVTVTDANGCSATDTLQMLVTVNVQPYILSEGVLIYPNPTHSTLSISFVNEKSDDIFLRLVDDNGKVAWSDFSVKEKRVIRTIDLEKMARGLYFFQIATTNIKKEFKVVLK